jgi:CubicO group peptidase (beta-lactamase class C family)
MLLPLLLLSALDATRLMALDAAVEAAIEEGQAPGAVVVIARAGKVVYAKAFGTRAKGEPMTLDTLFDLASLTKPVATASSIFKLIEAKKLRLEDPVAKYVPGFGAGVTVRQLLLHTSGLPAGGPTREFEKGKKAALKYLVGLSQKAEPDKKFVYSDLGYILLGYIVEEVSGQSLDAFCQEQVFKPLKMKDTGFLPDKAMHPRIAPTTPDLRGTVHDPRARALGGVAGHAGLFGTAADLVLFAEALQNGGLLAPELNKTFLTPVAVPGGQRTPGWDARTAYSSNRGDHFAGFGHTGFTGTSIWIDPASRTTVIVLTSRLQNPKGNVIALRKTVATLAAKAIRTAPYPAGRDKPVEDGACSGRGREQGDASDGFAAYLEP